MEKIEYNICEKCRPYFDLLLKRIEELEKRLLAYENAHTPPSKNFAKRERVERPKSPGRPKGHEGVTRAFRNPDKTVILTAKKCSHCGKRLGEPYKVERRIIEDMPKPVQATVTEFLQSFYICPHCGKEVETKHKDLPEKGGFGNNTLVHVSLMKFQDRLPYRKIQESLEREYGLRITPASILDFTRRVGDKLENQYNLIFNRVRLSDYVYTDETSIRVNGITYWVWTFVTATETLSIVRRSRGKNVVEEVLGKDYRGIIVCDGWKAYPKFTDKIQRCWAHLLREARFLSRKSEEARLLSDRLHRLYKNLRCTLDKGPPDNVRVALKMNAEESLRELIRKDYQSREVRKFATKIRNGFNHWFTFVTNPLIEPTNNVAERALREHVIQRKIMGTLRNEKGTQIHERMMTCMATWKRQGLNVMEELLKCVRS